MAVENLVDKAFTNHFKDHRIEFAQYGARLVGVACGDGDVDWKRAYQLIKERSPAERIIIENDILKQGYIELWHDR